MMGWVGLLLPAEAQLYPVQATPQLMPPYSVYLSDYATPGEEKLRLILLQRDLTQPAYQLRLVMQVELNGQVILRTTRSYNPPPISLNPGIPTIISGAELAPYLDSRNLDFVAYSREQYERTRALPEGSYQISFTAYDYRRPEVAVSNRGSSFYYLAKNEPPLINAPASGSRIPLRTPQQMIFSWLPRNTASPNSAADTQYELALYEIRPQGRNPNDLVLSTAPVFKTLLNYPQYVYSPADPLLLEGMTYAWRVRAIDRGGKDAFRNNGYSEVATFTYGGIDPDFDIGVVKGLQAQGETERRGRVWWSLGDYEGYRVHYRKTGKDYQWFTANVSNETFKAAGGIEGEVKLFDLEPDTGYETRVQGKKNGYLGGYSEVVQFRTPARRVVQCGQTDGADAPKEMGTPLLGAIKGSIVEADGIEVTLVEVLPLSEPGWHKGTGRINIPYLGGAVFPVQFERLYIREDRQVVGGRMDVVTQGVAALVEKQAANQARNNQEKIQEKNRAAWAGTNFYEKVFSYEQIVIDTLTVDRNGYLNITDKEGKTTVNAEVSQLLAAMPDRAILIQDQSGDQWVVQKDIASAKTTVTKVPGGGLSPHNLAAVDDAVLDLLKKALKELKKEYSAARIKDLEKQLDSKEKQWDQELANQDQKYGFATGTISTEEPGESVFFSWEDMEGSDIGSGNATDRQYKTLELAFNEAQVIQMLAQEGKNEQVRKDMAAELMHEGQNIQAYIQAQQALRKTEAEILPSVKSSIISFVNLTLKKYFVLKKK
jgi:hypothetical protein